MSNRARRIELAFAGVTVPSGVAQYAVPRGSTIQLVVVSADLDRALVALILSGGLGDGRRGRDRAAPRPGAGGVGGTRPRDRGSLGSPARRGAGAQTGGVVVLVSFLAVALL